MLVRDHKDYNSRHLTGCVVIGHSPRPVAVKDFVAVILGQAQFTVPRGHGKLMKFKTDSRFLSKMLKFKVNSRYLEELFGIQGFQGTLRPRGRPVQGLLEMYATRQA